MLIPYRKMELNFIKMQFFFSINNFGAFRTIPTPIKLISLEVK